MATMAEEDSRFLDDRRQDLDRATKATRVDSLSVHHGLSFVVIIVVAGGDSNM